MRVRRAAAATCLVLQHGGHVEGPLARRGVGTLVERRRDDARPAQLDGPAPLKATEDSQPLIRRDAARDVVSASIF